MTIRERPAAPEYLGAGVQETGLRGKRQVRGEGWEQREKGSFCVRRGPRSMAHMWPSHQSPHRITAVIATTSTGFFSPGSWPFLSRPGDLCPSPGLWCSCLEVTRVPCPCVVSRGGSRGHLELCGQGPWPSLGEQRWRGRSSSSNSPPLLTGASCPPASHRAAAGLLSFWRATDSERPFPPILFDFTSRTSASCSLHLNEYLTTALYCCLT